MIRHIYDSFALLFYLGVSCAGAIGFVSDPSTSLVEAVGYDFAVYVYSSFLLLFGILGVLSRFVMLASLEFWALSGIAFASATQGIALLVSNYYQLGTRMLFVPIPVMACAFIRRYRVDELLVHLLQNERR